MPEALTVSISDRGARPTPFPLSGLLALATAGFITILTEALPAGLLREISRDLHVTQAMTGQLVTIYAIGSLMAAIPLTAATRSMRRRPLLLGAITGFAVVNTITAVSSDYAVIMGARFLAGVSAGLLWALLAGYATRMVAPHQAGRAIAVAMVGTPIALSLGVPAGTFLGGTVGWRVSFGIMTALSVALIGWTLWKVPDFAGETGGDRASLRRVLTMPGIRPILFVTLTFVLAHNILYTYIASYLQGAGLAGQVDRILLAFGIAAFGGIWVVGVRIDRWLRGLSIASVMIFLGGAILLGVGTAAPAIYAGVLVWGLAFGGAATLFQTASTHAAGTAADVAQSMIVTAWNIAIAGGGLIGGYLLETRGAGVLPWSLCILLVPCLVIVLTARRHGFPSAARI
ncbi:MFS transporter [Sphingomonas sp. CFBP 13603]|uniref:MFS transporter n=1 Tax=Sphingomonas sp. CFBP 13603 TaxID=2774040 RepID=UPI0018663969|nr:MFS transporter [Sphingomonas sp. CFBP 13603]MBE2992512.1 MFS transporter [Sphingomonas sp. CFBP 13603]